MTSPRGHEEAKRQGQCQPVGREEISGCRPEEGARRVWFDETVYNDDEDDWEYVSINSLVLL